MIFLYVCSGFYNVEVTDGLGCLDTATVEVTEPITISAAAVDSSGVTCYDGNDGYSSKWFRRNITRSYWWDDPSNQTNDTAINLFGRVHRAAVTDENGCSDTVTIIIYSPDTLMPNETIVNTSCKGICDGFVSVALSGGTKGTGYTHHGI